MSAVTTLVGALALLAAAALATIIGLSRRGRRFRKQGQADAEARMSREILRNVEIAEQARRRLERDDAHADRLRRRFTR